MSAFEINAFAKANLGMRPREKKGGGKFALAWYNKSNGWHGVDPFGFVVNAAESWCGYLPNNYYDNYGDPAVLVSSNSCASVV